MKTGGVDIVHFLLCRLIINSFYLYIDRGGRLQTFPPVKINQEKIFVIIKFSVLFYVQDEEIVRNLPHLPASGCALTLFLYFGRKSY